MADLDFDVLMQGLAQQRELLASLSTNANDKANIRNKINATIKGFREQYEAAKTEKEKAAICGHVADVAKGLEAAGAATGALVQAVQSGDPFAISAATLTLAASLISTISLAGGPVGAAVGAVIGAILSIISMILGLFQKESASLISEIEKLMRDLKAEAQIEKLRTANNHISAFSGLASTKIQRNADKAVKDLLTGQIYTPTEPNKTYTFIKSELNENTIDEIIDSMNFLLTKGNQDISLWTEVVSLACQIYASYKLSIVSWLPLVELVGVDDLMDWRDSYDGVVLDFLENIKPAARNRGIICHAGTGGIYAREIVITNKKTDWIKFEGNAHSIVASYRTRRFGQGVSPNPPLSILHLGGRETFDADSGARSTFDRWKLWPVSEVEKVDKSRPEVRREILKAKLNPFSKKSAAYDLDGHWPVAPEEWSHLAPLEVEGAYDIWAIPGNKPGEISVYTATGGAVSLYTEKGGDQHIELIRTNPTKSSYKAGAVRAVRPKSLPEDGETVLKDCTEAVYELCKVEDDKTDYPFQIWAFFMSAKGPLVDGAILPPRPLDPKDWRNFPIGISVDSKRLWVFSTFFIACVSHTNIKQHLEKKELTPDWMIYYIPKELLDYDPKELVSMGLMDFSACDDGTLTAVFKNKLTIPLTGPIDPDGFGRIYTATPKFDGGKLTMEGQKVDKWDDIKVTHGWAKDPDPGTVARRVHKLPIFCWPLIEGLENALAPKTRALPPGARAAALPGGPALNGLTAPRTLSEATRSE
jgi:hypothetical protein